MTIDSWSRYFIPICLAAGVVSLIVVLDYSGYPNPPHQLWILEYNLRTQDVPGAALLMALVVAACFVPGRVAALALVERMARHPWRVAAVTFTVLCLGTLYVEQNHPLAQDEYAALLQSRIFAAGRLTGHFPPELLGRLIPPFYMNQFVYGSFQTGAIASAYWPGFALLLAPFTLVHAPWACNALLAALALVLMARIAQRLTGEPLAGGWAMLCALASPGFTGMAISYFSMTAHLVFNLAFVWLLLERTPLRLVLAGLVGSYALVLHNPVPHALFALPWIVWLALQPQRYRNLLALAAGYVPIALVLGFGWAWLLSGIQGNALLGLFPHDDNPLHHIANFFWNWHIKMRSALAGPGDNVVATRVAELVRLWNWALPGLLLLAGAGWWLARSDVRVRLLGLSVVSTLVGFLFVGFTQGHGWGARYVHPAWGVLPVLAAVALVRIGAADARARIGRYVATLALLSLVCATTLRALQIHEYMERHLANRPPALQEGRQIVFVTHDWTTYTSDLVQNDPFLRNAVWTMFSFDRKSDAAFMSAKFPHARRVHSDRRGEVWRLDPP